MKNFILKLNLVLFKSLMLTFGLLFSTDVLAVGELPFGYRANGVDTYADGVTPVRDGECYALVWIADNAEFGGFLRNGALATPDVNAVAFVESLAKGGCCNGGVAVDFLIDAGFLKSHPNGMYRVVVLDTCGIDGQPLALDDAGRLIRVNGWGWANVKRISTLKAKAFASVNAFGGATVANGAPIPANCPQPVITGIAPQANGDVVLTVKNTASYLYFQSEKGAEAIGEGERVGEQKLGAAEEPLTLTITKAELKGATTALFAVRGN